MIGSRAISPARGPLLVRESASTKIKVSDDRFNLIALINLF